MERSCGWDSLYLFHFYAVFQDYGHTVKTDEPRALTEEIVSLFHGKVQLARVNRAFTNTVTIPSIALKVDRKRSRSHSHENANHYLGQIRGRYDRSVRGSVEP